MGGREDTEGRGVVDNCCLEPQTGLLLNIQHERHLQLQGLLPAHVLLHPNFNQGTQMTVKFAKRIQISVRCAGQNTERMSRAETIKEIPLSHTQDRARGPRCTYHFEMREIKGFKRNLEFQTPQEAGTCGAQVRGYLIWRPSWSPAGSPIHGNLRFLKVIWG